MPSQKHNTTSFAVTLALLLAPNNSGNYFFQGVIEVKKHQLILYNNN